MKLLQINSVYRYASTGRTTYELENCLTQLGWDCYAACAEMDFHDDHHMKLGSLNFHRIHSLLARLFGLQGFFSPFTTAKLLRWIRKVKPDVVHLRNLHSNYISIMPLLRYLAKHDIPTVVTLHDFFFFTGGCCFADDYGCEKWHTACSQCPQNKKALIDLSPWVHKQKLKAFGKIRRLAVVGVAKWTTKQYDKLQHLPHAISRTIYNWIDLDTFAPAQADKGSVFTQKQKDKFVILGVATGWSREKGLQDFLTLAQSLPEEASVVLVGNVPKTVPLPENITAIGPVKDVTKLAACYNAADVFVSMSYRETFGKVIAEAVSCGTPAVVYDITACGEIVADGAGYAVTPGAVDQVLAAVENIRSAGKQAYTAACRAHAEKHFDMHKNVLQYQQLYQELMDR